MRYYRCKCGKNTAYGSMPPYQCSKCEDCGSDLAEHPDHHREPKPHDFSDVQKVQTDQGEMTVTHCRYCGRTKAQIDREIVASTEPK